MNDIPSSSIIDAIHGYSDKQRRKLRQEFLDFNIATDKKPQKNVPHSGAVNIDGLSLTNQLEKCINEHTQSIPVFERWETIKNYSYSVLFTVECFSEFLDAVKSAETNFAESQFPLLGEIRDPAFWDFHDEIALLKFLRGFIGTNPATGKTVTARYPIVVVFHKKLEIIELRYDSLSRFLMDESSGEFYQNLVNKVMRYFKEKYNVEFIPMNLDFLIELSKGEREDVVRIAQAMNMDNGSRAKLDIGHSTETTLPLIGELKQLLDVHADKFAASPELKQIFEDFIIEKEEHSEFPWITLRWSKQVSGGKTKDIDVKFIFNYYQQGYCVLSHYSGLTGMERMNDVVKFIKANQPDTTR